MAQLNGKGAFQALPLLVKTYNNNVTKDGKTRFLDVQIDHRDERGKTQTNLHLSSRRTTDPETGKTIYDNGAPYTSEQYDAMREAAGPNAVPLLDSEKNVVGEVLGVSGDVMKSNRGPGLIINTKTLGQSQFRVDENTLDDQYKSMKAAKETKAAEPTTEVEQGAEQTQEAEQVAEQETEPAY